MYTLESPVEKHHPGELNNDYRNPFKFIKGVVQCFSMCFFEKIFLLQ